VSEENEAAIWSVTPGVETIGIDKGVIRIVFKGGTTFELTVRQIGG